MTSTTSNILDGKKLSLTIQKEIKQQVDSRVASGFRPPHLVAVLVGDDPASHTYVNNKMKACRNVGFQSSIKHFDEKISEQDLLNEINRLNHDEQVDGFIVQLPLPRHINVSRVIEKINPAKDVDGFHPINIGKMVLGLPCFLPATPQGILIMLERYHIETSGKHCVILGRSHIVGRPLSVMLSRKSHPGNCTVTVCHSHTPDIAAFTRQADILISAMGKPGFVKENMVKNGVVIIDVGTSRVEDLSAPRGWRLKGDVDFENVAGKASWITPVPGGVGPMTITSLLLNTLKAAKKEIFETA